MQYRWAPSSFELDDSSCTPTRIPHTPWTFGETIFARHPGSIALVRIPPVWQFEMPVHEACRSNDITPCYVHPENQALAIAAIKELRPRIIITATDALPNFALALAEADLLNSQIWLVIKDHRRPWQCPPQIEQSMVYVEDHISPGVPLHTP